MTVPLREPLSANTQEYERLLTASRSFFSGAIFEAFKELEVEKLLANASKSANFIAVSLQLNEAATERFLNAAASIGLLKKNADQTYTLVQNHPKYSASSADALFWLVRTRLPDVLAKKPLTRGEIISNYGASAGEFLDTAIESNFIIAHGDTYSNTSSTQKLLVSTSAEYLGPQFTHYEKVMRPMFSKKGLLGALKSGKSQWSEIFGEGVSNPFDLYATNKALLDIFMNGMHQLNAGDNAILAARLDLQNVATVLDVGGGSGPFSIELLKANNAIKKIDIYELPDAIPVLEPVLKKYSNDTRIGFVPGSFLAAPTSDLLSGINAGQKYDLVILGWILHDWNDQTALQILRKVYSHLTENGRVIILEQMLPQDRTGPVTTLDLAMLLQTEGKERTFPEFQELLSNARFKEVRTFNTSTRRQIIEARGKLDNS